MTGDFGSYPRQARHWLAELDDGAQQAARRARLETLVDAVLAIVGLLLLRWSPYPMLLFLLATLWLGLLETCLLWFVDRGRLLRSVAEARDLEEARSLVRQRPDHPPYR